MGSSTISLGLGLGGGKAATSSGSPASGGGYKNEYAISCDGTDDYLTATLGSQVFDGDFSISFWFNADTAPAYTTLIQSGSNSGYNDGFRIYRYSNTALAFWKGQGGYSNIFGNIGTTATGSWHHIVVTRSGTTSTFYLNGSSIDTGTDSQTYTSTAFQMSFTTYPLDGLMDEVALWDSALSSANVNSIYNSGTPADISSLSPVNWWRMGDNDGASGTTITDQGSGSNDATLTNGPTFSTDVPEYVFNRYSVSFDASDDYVTATLGSQVFDGDFSISAWFNASTSPQYLTLLQLGDAAAYTDGWRLYRNYSQLQFWDGVGGYSLILEGGSTSASSWHHVAITRSGTTCTLYLNGNSTDTGTSSEVFTSTAFKISFTYFPFNGLVDEVALWDSALSSPQITNIYKGEENGGSGGTNGIPGDLSTFGPVNWWRMGDNDGGTGTTVTDQGSASNNGTLTNGPTFSTDVPS